MSTPSSILFLISPPDSCDADYQRHAEGQVWENGATSPASESSAASGDRFMVSIEQLLFIEPF